MSFDFLWSARPLPTLRPKVTRLFTNAKFLISIFTASCGQREVDVLLMSLPPFLMLLLPSRWSADAALDLIYSPRRAAHFSPGARWCCSDVTFLPVSPFSFAEFASISAASFTPTTLLYYCARIFYRCSILMLARRHARWLRHCRSDVSAASMPTAYLSPPSATLLAYRSICFHSWRQNDTSAFLGVASMLSDD